MTNRELAREICGRRFRIGYIWEDDLEEALIDAVVDAHSEIYLEDVEKFIAEEVEERRREEATWAGPTDHDRLVAAFAELDAAGIIAREDFGPTVGEAEENARKEAARRRTEGAAVRGVLSFCRQDAEGAADGTLLLSAEAVTRGDDVGQLVVGTLGRHGLAAERRGARIAVRTPDWRVRCVTGDPERRSLTSWNEIWTPPDDDDDE